MSLCPSAVAENSPVLGISLSIFIFGTESSMCLNYATGDGGEVEARSGATVGIHPNRFKV